MERRIFPEGADTRGRVFDSLRWSRFKNESPSEMFVILGIDDSTCAHRA